jgi:hypothetical protein
MSLFESCLLPPQLQPISLAWPRPLSPIRVKLLCNIHRLHYIMPFCFEKWTLNRKKWRNKNSHSRFDIGFLKTNEIKLRSEATSLFDVQRWTFDVHFFSKPSTVAQRRNNLALAAAQSR